MTNGTTECPSTLADVSEVAYYIEIVSSALVVFSLLACTCCICTHDAIEDGETKGETGVWCLGIVGAICYPVSGILSIAGCSLFASKLSDAQYGRSFFFCLSAGIITAILVLSLLFYQFCDIPCCNSDKPEINQPYSGRIHLPDEPYYPRDSRVDYDDEHLPDEPYYPRDSRVEFDDEHLPDEPYYPKDSRVDYADEHLPDDPYYPRELRVEYDDERLPNDPYYPMDLRLDYSDEHLPSFGRIK